MARRMVVGGETRWEVRLREGGRGSKSIRRRFLRKDDADRFETEALRAKQLGSGIRNVASRLTLDEYAGDWWDRVAGELAGTTQVNYKGTLKRYVLPRLGHHRLSAIDTPTVNRFKTGLQADGKGADTIRHAGAVLSAFFSDAVLNGQIQMNPCRGVKWPKAARQGAIRPLPPSEVERLLHVMPTEQDAVFVSLMAYAGLRPEEALALKWADVQKTTVIIDKAVALGEIKTTKTGQNRWVDLLDPLAEDLAAYRKSLGVIPGPGAFLFPHPRDPSRPWGDSTYRNWRGRTFNRAAKNIGLQATPYTLRHSFISLMLAAGMRRSEVAEQAGHSLAVMESTYAHVIAEFRGIEMSDPAAAIREARVSPVRHRDESVAAKQS